MKAVQLRCNGCKKRPDEISEYVEAAKTEGISPNQYVWKEEGTLNKENGHFLCTMCYMDAGMPEAAGGWKAP